MFPPIEIAVTAENYHDEWRKGVDERTDIAVIISELLSHAPFGKKQIFLSQKANDLLRHQAFKDKNVLFIGKCGDEFFCDIPIKILREAA